MYCLCRVTSPSTWRHCDLDQRVINMAVRQWHTGLHVCVKAKGGRFEHKLRTHICFSEWLQCLPAFIVDFRCCLCDKVDFCPIHQIHQRQHAFTGITDFSYPSPFVPKNEKSLWRTFVPRERKVSGTKVPHRDYSFFGTKGLGHEKSRYPFTDDAGMHNHPTSVSS